MKGSRAQAIYKSNLIYERHRHRYEFNNKYRDLFDKNGMLAVGKNKDRDLVEIVELPDHPWFIGVQFHPEFKSKPLNPHPLFSQFVKAALNRKKLVDMAGVKRKSKKVEVQARVI
jgi:CTP synthase